DLVPTIRFLPSLVDRRSTPNNTSPSLRLYYGGFITTTGRSALPTRDRYSGPHDSSPLAPLPLASHVNPWIAVSRRGVLQFRCEARTELAPRSCRTPPDQ